MAEIGVWPQDMRTRVRFERGARRLHSTLRGRPLGTCGVRGFRYDVDIDVPFYDRRHTSIQFHRYKRTPKVRVDGPANSPHRYDDGGLCMWFPQDDVAHRWTFDDGLADLIDVIVAHLFREAWWREAGEWLGDEVPHQQVTQEAA